MKVLVTGGAGFIGSNLAAALTQYHDVVVLDDLSLGSRTAIPRGVKFREGSILDDSLLDDILDGVDCIFHQAASPSVPRSVKDPMRSHQINSTGTLTVLEAARRNDVKSVVMASSSSVYGESEELPKHEGMPWHPLSPYAVDKVTVEAYGRLYADLYGIATTCLRYFNVFGPGQRPDDAYSAVIPRFIRAALRGEPLAIYGDGEQSRDFTFIVNVVEANRLAWKNGGNGQAYNVGAGRRVTVNELARQVIELTGSESSIEHQPPRPGDIRHSLASLDRIQAELHYRPLVNFEDGLKRTVAWLREASDA